MFEVRKRKKITSRQNNGICVSVLFEFIQLKKKRKMKLNFFLHASKWIMSILLRIDSFFFCASWQVIVVVHMKMGLYNGHHWNLRATCSNKNKINGVAVCEMTNWLHWTDRNPIVFCLFHFNASQSSILKCVVAIRTLHCGALTF